LLRGIHRWPKIRLSNDHFRLQNAPGFDQGGFVDLVNHVAQVPENEPAQAVPAPWGCGQTQHIATIKGRGCLGKRPAGGAVAFVQNQVPNMRRNLVSHFVKALHQGHGDPLTDHAPTVTDNADLAGRDTEKGLDTVNPLLCKLSGMHHN